MADLSHQLKTHDSTWLLPGGFHIFAIKEVILNLVFFLLTVTVP